MMRPKFESVPLATGLRWRASPAWRYEEKLDGRWHELGIGKSRIVGELMRDGRFFAFDIPVYDGQDIRRLPLRERLAILATFPLLRPATGDGGAFLQEVLGRGGEGVVAKHLESAYGESWVKCKRVETFDCLITAVHPAKLSVRLALDGQDVGWCGCTSSRLQKLAVGDVVEVAAHSRHSSGKLREPRFVKFRPDKEQHDNIEPR